MSYGCVVDVCEIGRSEDAWYKSLHAIELDQFDITDDATDWGLGRPFVMDMRESLASSVHIKRPTWIRGVLLGQYLQEVVLPRALTGRGGVVGWNNNSRGV
ncbi:hypothetical protein T310_3356 [Rasamsonia emersonii CBS 393.64]|uniref:Uncharacterized protein n=1 Tax=Rasamsonia emersonii (strain ATCC 16479 / CBS 393.64 / IMI 116815) TaxID=1408163 RepID=A0A0F4YWM1_RASE3|nr:hypothetical protein T310_3356 [Rasamsonia emersonii CBS 393.64]KKA22619.1 hypothetical protein T310_3356 [Rasamsonia emersonii CBS 393.64]